MSEIVITDEQFIDLLRQIGNEVKEDRFSGVIVGACEGHAPFIKTYRGNAEQRLSVITGVIESMLKEPSEESKIYFFNELYNRFIIMYGASFINNMYRVYIDSLNKDIDDKNKKISGVV